MTYTNPKQSSAPNGMNLLPCCSRNTANATNTMNRTQMKDDQNKHELTQMETPMNHGIRLLRRKTGRKQVTCPNLSPPMSMKLHSF
jgi:hypothetical protein